VVVVLLIDGVGIGYLINDQGRAELVGMAITDGRCDGSNCGDLVVAASAQKLVDAGRYNSTRQAQWCEGVESFAFIRGNDDIYARMSVYSLDVAAIPCPKAR
jgi:hypothetical protein